MVKHSQILASRSLSELDLDLFATACCLPVHTWHCVHWDWPNIKGTKSQANQRSKKRSKDQTNKPPTNPRGQNSNNPTPSNTTTNRPNSLNHPNNPNIYIPYIPQSPQQISPTSPATPTTPNKPINQAHCPYMSNHAKIVKNCTVTLHKAIRVRISLALPLFCLRMWLPNVVGKSLFLQSSPGTEVA
jgi:hypothetical protein